VPTTDAPVLAVDIPSGIDARSGEGEALHAARTVTFVGVKAGLLLGNGAERAGEIVVADIGLDGSAAAAHLIEDDDVVLPAPRRDTHKWKAAVWIVAGSRGMTGAAVLATRGAQRGGASYVRLFTPGGPIDAPVEVVQGPWEPEQLERFRAVVVGPGLGRASDADVRELVASAMVPVVVDGDGLTALGPRPSVPPQTVLTPHDGEFERLTGERPGPDRLDAARTLARTTGGIALLKGPTTVVGAPDGRVLVAAAGDGRLATAGSGDVLSGLIGAFLARGVPPFEAAAWAAHVHGRAASLGVRSGFVAGDLPDLLPQVLDALPVG
jgi:NAD(P)H-hydrate epimerase